MDAFVGFLMKASTLQLATVAAIVLVAVVVAGSAARLSTSWSSQLDLVDQRRWSRRSDW